MRALAAALPVLALPALATAGTFPTRFGESGLLDVPDAQTLTLGRGAIYGEFRYDVAPGNGTAAPFPLALGVGLGRALEAGLALRQSGRPGDPNPSPTLFTGALKLRLLEGRGSAPAVAADVYADRFNFRPVTGLRLIASTAEVGRLRFAGYAGGEAHGPGTSLAATGGFAVAIAHSNGMETVLEGTIGPGGPLTGGAFRWELAPDLGASVGLGWLPSDRAWHVSLGLALASPVLRRRVAEPPPEPAPPAAAPAKPAVPQFLDERPRFRLGMPARGLPGSSTGPRHVQHPASLPPLRPEAPARPARPPAAEQKQATRVPGAEDRLAARQRRLHQTEAELAAREQRHASEAARLDAAEQALLARERELQGLAKRTSRAAKPGRSERDARARERQASAAEARAARAEAGLRARARAAQRREAAARARQARLEGPPAKLEADLSREKAPARQAELLARLDAARERRLGAMEERLSATRDRLDLLDRASAARGERLAARGRRADAVEERLAATRRAAEDAALAAARHGPVKGEEPATAAAPPASTAPASPAAGAAATSPGAGLRAGVTVGKAVVASALVSFPAAGQPPRQLDREAVEDLARLAARESCQLLIWARAQNPGLVVEATRRAEELKLLAVKAGPLAEARVVTRVTTRPSATGVEVVVLALRERPVARAAPEGMAPPAAALAEGEAGKRQVREAALQYRPDIESCLEAEMARGGLESGEVTLMLRVDREGKVTSVVPGESVASSSPLERCLRAAAPRWRFPASGRDYTVELPITVVGAEARP